MVNVHVKTVFTHDGSGDFTCYDVGIGSHNCTHTNEPILGYTQNVDYFHSTDSGFQSGNPLTITQTLNLNVGDVLHSGCYKVFANCTTSQWINGRKVGSSNNITCTWDRVTITAPMLAPQGGIDGTPTYLETLDKLDQWSKAQYIPDSMGFREINI